MAKLTQEQGRVLCRDRQERISLESQFCFACGFVTIMVVLLLFLSFLVCEQLKEAEENGLSSGKWREDRDSLPL